MGLLPCGRYFNQVPYDKVSHKIAVWCNGSTRDFGSLSRGSSPLTATKLFIIMARKSSLGKILRKINEGTDSSESRNSIVADIDKACASGVTCTGAFSALAVKRQCKQLLSLLDEESFNRDKFFSEFSKFYTLVMAPDKRAKGVFHPSQLLTACERQMVFDLMGTAPSDHADKGVTATLQRVFDVGTWYHVYMQSILYQIGLLEQAEVPVVNKEKYLNGKADGVFKTEVFGEKVVLEIKTMNSWIYQKAVFRPFAKHEFQASLYARELGATKVLYLYINKDTSEIKDFLMPVNYEQLEEADKKMDSVIAHVKAGTMPARGCSTKMCDNALACPFATLCFDTK